MRKVYWKSNLVHALFITHFRDSNFKYKMKRLQIPQNSVREVAAVKKFYVHEIAPVDLSKIYFLKNAKKTCKPSNRDLNRDWKSTYQNTEENALYYKKRKIPIYLTKTALKRTSNAIFNMKRINLDESWLNRSVASNTTFRWKKLCLHTSKPLRKKYRSSHQRCSVTKSVLRYFAKFTGKNLCQSLSF